MPPQKFNVGLMQMSTTSDPDRNLAARHRQVHQASARGAQIVCLPELFQTQYFCQREDANLFDLAQPIPSPVTNRLAALAKQLRIVLIASAIREARARRVSQHGRRLRRRRISARPLSQDAHPR